MNEDKVMVVRLCKAESCCPEVKLSKTHVQIGENDNICTLSREQWEILKEKIINKEI
jgi:hypothetical protein